MSKFKNVLTGISTSTQKQNINIPALNNLDAGNATPEDVQNVLNHLRAAQDQYVQGSMEMTILGRAIEDIETLPGENFQ